MRGSPGCSQESNGVLDGLRAEGEKARGGARGPTQIQGRHELSQSGPGVSGLKKHLAQVVVQNGLPPIALVFAQQRFVTDSGGLVPAHRPVAIGQEDQHSRRLLAAPQLRASRDGVAEPQ